MSGPVPDRAGVLAERLSDATIGALELFAVYLGDRARASTRRSSAHGPLTAAELAERAGIAPRYAREWLEQQAVAGFLVVDDAPPTRRARRFALPAEHAACSPTPTTPTTSRRSRTCSSASPACCRRSPRPTAPAPACPTPATAPTSATARATSTVPPSRTTCPASGCRPCPDVVARLESRRRPRSPTSAAATAGRPSRVARAFPDARGRRLRPRRRVDRRRPRARRRGRRRRPRPLRRRPTPPSSPATARSTSC